MSGEDKTFEEGDVTEKHVAVIPPEKPKDPRSKAKYNFISQVLFCWVGGLLRHGCRHDLEHSDLYAHPSEADSEKLHGMFNRYWGQELDKMAKGQTPRLWLVILKCFWWRFILQGLVIFSELSLFVGQAVILGQLIRYFSLPCDQRDNIETRNAYLYGAGLVLLGFAVTCFHAHGFIIAQVIGMMSRIMMTSAIYNKVLTLSQVTISQVSVGHIINLASNDVQRFDMAFLFVQYLWISPLHLIISTYLIYLEIGWIAFVIIALILMVVPLQFFMAKAFAKLRLKSAKLTDKRVHMMNEVITGIRVIKMYAWEYAFKKVVNQLRKYEVKLITYGGIIRILSASFNFAGVTPFIFGITFLVFVGSGGELTTQRVFTTLSLFNILRRTSVTFIVRCFFQIYEASVAIKRIQVCQCHYWG